MRSWARSIPAAILVAALSVLPGHDGKSEAMRAGGAKPNIVLILTDDQRFDELEHMPIVNAELAGRGVQFQQSFVVNPNCCPSRTSILTGRYSHSTGVYTDIAPTGGFAGFNDSSTAATWLHDAGYATALVGKYLNGYSGRRASYIPPGWDRWVAFTHPKGLGAYYDYRLSVDGTSVSYDSAPQDYSTDVLRDYATAFIRGVPPGQPLFLYFAPKAPHVPPKPGPTYVDALSSLPKYRPPSYNEADVSDKPAYIQGLPVLTDTEQKTIDRQRRNMYRTLLSVDDAVGAILQSLSDTGRLSDTLIMFASDNGYLWGEHRWNDKYVPYEESIRVPLIVRYDPLIPSPRVDSTHLALNIDYAPTFAEVAGVAAPGADGASLVPLLAGPLASWRSDFVVEHAPAGSDTVPAYCELRNAQYAYVLYSTGEEELYELPADPFELDNRASDPSYDAVRGTLHDRTLQLCSPLPPGFGPG